jgi:hypothetical protein
MTPPDAGTFLAEITASLKRSFPSYSIEFLLRTPKALKINVQLKEGLFIAVRYNSRNGRTDFALIKDGKRVFGYDNLKEWHYHPSDDPSTHVPCDKPSVDWIISEISRVCAGLS